MATSSAVELSLSTTGRICAARNTVLSGAQPAERVNSLLKDNHGGRHVRVRGAPQGLHPLDVWDPGVCRRADLAPAPLGFTPPDEVLDACRRGLPVA